MRNDVYEGVRASLAHADGDAYLTVGDDCYRIKVVYATQDMTEIDPLPLVTFYASILSGYPCRAPRSDRLLEIKDVIFNPPATIVFWGDGTKTVVQSQSEDFDPEKGIAMAYWKKSAGNKGNYFNEVKKWASKYDDKLYRTRDLNHAFDRCIFDIFDAFWRELGEDAKRDGDE